MNPFRTFFIFVVMIFSFFIRFLYQADAAAPGPKVSEESTTGNKHNLSAKAWKTGTYTGTNPNTYRATDDAAGNPKGQQICIFCHTPHNANVEGGAPLWNRAFSSQTFSRYSSTTLRIRVDATTRSNAGYDDPPWKPDGSSKLCLSCHDGVSSLGTMLGGVTVIMNAGDVISGTASFTANNKMKTGHHPVSFVYNSTVVANINSIEGAGQYAEPSLAEVKRDKNSKMQCTTCHDAHQNKSHDDDCYGGACTTTSRKKAPFWVYHSGSNTASQDRDAVCTTCHKLTPVSTDNILVWP